MTRSFAVLLGVALLGAAESPAPVAPVADRVTELAGTWTCRSPFGTRSTVVYRSDGRAIVADETYADGSSARHDRFTPDRAGGWRIEHTTAGDRSTGHAPPWTADSWVIDVADRSKIRYERIDDRTIRRTIAGWSGVAYDGVVCAKGDAPPDPALCALRDVPTRVMRAVEPDTPLAAMQSRISGIVQVLVSLDAGGNVTNATIQRTASPVLNDSALGAARQSTYRPALHDCKPIPSQYIFSVDYSA